MNRRRSASSRTSTRPGSTTPSPAALRCAIYTRKSVAKKVRKRRGEDLDDGSASVAPAGSDDVYDQADPYGTCDAQRDLCEHYCAAQGWSVVERRYDDDGVSGSTMKRPALRELLADVAAGKVDRIVVYRIDRWSRSLSDYFRLGEQLAAADVALASISERIDTDSALGRFQLGLLLLMAQYERENAGERTAAKAKAAKARGLCVGAVPFGQRLAADGVSLEDDPAEQAAIELMLELHGQGRGARAICSELRRRGLRPRGTDWHATTVSRVLKQAESERCT